MQLASSRASAGWRNSPASGWVDCAVGRFAFANAFSLAASYTGVDVGADKEGRQW